ncbi:hypothetical protein PAXRUDRAFT_775619, partial [Paxillus rubicundulus Ve08.2h10]
MGFMEMSAHYGDSRGNVEFCGLADLTLMTGSAIPFDVFNQHRPPKTHEETSPDSEHALVTEVIMGLLKEQELFVGWGVDLVMSMGV